MNINVPILRQGTSLIASVQDALNDNDLQRLTERLLAEVVRVKAKGVVIDVSVLDVIDSFSTRMLSNLAMAVEMRGAKTVIVGIQPEVALAMVLLGLSMPNIATALDLDAGLAILQRPVVG